MASWSDASARPARPRWTSSLLTDLSAEQQELSAAGSVRGDRVYAGSPTPVVELDRRELVNLSSNDYLGLASSPQVVGAAERALRDYGAGTATGRVISGTRRVHRELEDAIAEFVGTEAAILYGSCYDANVGLFQPLLGEEDVIVSDALNHASIIDGVRLSSARRSLYEHADPAHLEARLREAGGARHVVVVTDGVFSMEGDLAPLPEIFELADRHAATVVVDDAHATGVVGPAGRGTCEHFGLEPRVLTGTLGKALGGGTGGFVAGPTDLVETLRRRSRSYIFTNPIVPSVAAAALAALELARDGAELRARLFANVAQVRKGLSALGYQMLEGSHPIVPVMLRGGTVAADLAAALLDLGVLAVALSHPIVPRGEERIRIQVSASHTTEQLAVVLDAFARAGTELGVL
jgi:glycine C-acetyltransferase